MADKNKKQPKKPARAPAHFPTVQPPLPIEPMQSNADPLGSYTGTPLDGGVPIQDADDL